VLTLIVGCTHSQKKLGQNYHLATAQPRRSLRRPARGQLVAPGGG
jgi:hypothetical protein